MVGLMAMRLSEEEIARLLVVEDRHRGRLRRLIVKFGKSRCPVIRKILRKGLPSHSACELPCENVVRCKGCGGLINSIPCVKCTCGNVTIKTTESAAWRLPERPTGFSPGSKEKIELMRERVSKRESPFHPRDRRV